MSLNEADTRARLIDPQLEAAGWGASQIGRERAEAFVNRESRFLAGHPAPAREVILALLDKYRAAGIEEIADARVFRLPPFLEMGQAPGVVRRFGSAERLQQSLRELERRIYM